MASSDAFALAKSDLNPFLFAAVGTELDGSELTILSLLARLGSDPWVEAARLAALPKIVATDWLAERIAATPLTAQALADGRATALRTILLLPAPSRTAKATPVPPTAAGVPKSQWAVILLVLCALAIGVAASVMHGFAPSTVSDPAAPQDRAGGSSSRESGAGQ